MKKLFLIFLISSLLLVFLVENSHSDHPEGSKPKASDESKEWPAAIVEAGKKTGLGSEGYVRELRKNCQERNIVGACQVLEVNGIPLKDEL